MDCEKILVSLLPMYNNIAGFCFVSVFTLILLMDSCGVIAGKKDHTCQVG